MGNATSNIPVPGERLPSKNDPSKEKSNNIFADMESDGLYPPMSHYEEVTLEANQIYQDIPNLSKDIEPSHLVSNNNVSRNTISNLSAHGDNFSRQHNSSIKS